MRYFLDFDRTLFDTDGFWEYLRKGPFGSHIPDSAESSVLGEMFNLIAQAGKLAFRPGELAQFVYPDVMEFLRSAGNEATIVTYGNPLFQRLKVESALHGMPRVSALYTGNDLKGPYLASRTDASARAVFVDDTALQLESVAAHFPEFSIFEMRRDKGPGDGRWAVVHSLYDLP